MNRERALNAQPSTLNPQLSTLNIEWRQAGSAGLLGGLRKSKKTEGARLADALSAAANFQKQCFLFTGKWVIIPPASVSDGFRQGVSRSTFP
jgi:hypothetical protein